MRLNSPLIFHAQKEFGPFTYTDRELWGVRARALWFRRRVILQWRVR